MRTFHAEGVTARAKLLQGFLTAAQAADPMLETVAFFHAATDRALAIDEVPPRLFSETVRDDAWSSPSRTVAAWTRRRAPRRWRCGVRWSKRPPSCSGSTTSRWPTTTR
jgi:hypothetical protein